MDGTNPKIISAQQKAGWGKPELIDKYELQEVELRLPIPNETGGQTGSPKTIEKVFELIKDNPYITRQELVDKIGIKASAFLLYHHPYILPKILGSYEEKS